MRIQHTVKSKYSHLSFSILSNTHLSGIQGRAKEVKQSTVSDA